MLMPHGGHSSSLACAGGKVDPLALILTYFLLTIITLQIGSFIIGILEGNSAREELLTNKWRFIFPLRNLGFRISRWLSK
jgi:hypothetical protein